MNPVRITTIVSVFAGLLAIAACEREPSGAAGKGGFNAATKVITTVIQPERLVDEIQALGTAKANESIEITPRISSVVMRVAFDEGEFVQKGDLLIELENSEILAGLAVAQASLGESTSTYNRSRSLIDTQAISASNLEQLQAAMQVDLAEVEEARARLAHTLIKAPFAGSVGLRRVSPGGYVDTSTVITTLDDTQTIKLDFSIPEIFLTEVASNSDQQGRAIACCPLR